VLRTKRIALAFGAAVVVYLACMMSMAQAACLTNSMGCLNFYLSQEVPYQSAYTSNPPENLLNVVLQRYKPSHVMVYNCSPYNGAASFIACVRWSDGNLHDYAFLHYVQRKDGAYACNGAVFSILDTDADSAATFALKNGKDFFGPSMKILDTKFAGGAVLAMRKNAPAHPVGFGMYGKTRFVYAFGVDEPAVATVFRLAWSTQAEMQIDALPRSKSDWWTGWHR